jgi:DNA-binding NarL/FixJ family response regulator
MVVTIRVLVADNHPTFCAGIRAILDKTDDLQIVEEAYDLPQLHSQSRESSPDILLIAANLATDSLLDTASDWKQQFADSKLLIMLPQADEIYLRQLTEQGADGVILKTEPTDKFIQAIRLVSQGESWLSKTLWQKMTQPEVPPVLFTEQEEEILPYIPTEMTIEAMAVTLHLAPRTVDRRIERICQKLGVTKRIGAAVQLIRLGLA